MGQYVGKLAMLSFFAAMWVALFGWVDNLFAAFLVMGISLVVALFSGISEERKERRETIEREKESIRRLSHPTNKNTDTSGSV